MEKEDHSKLIASRAEYFKERRKVMKQFNVMVDRKKMEKFEGILRKQERTKVSWLNEKIDEELEKHNN